MTRIRRWGAILPLVLLAGAAPPDGALTITVGETGDYRTIGDALEAAGRTGLRRISVAPGRYDEPLVLDTRVTGLTLQASSAGVVLTGSLTLDDLADVRIDGFAFARSAVAISVHRSIGVAITCNRFDDVGAGIVLDATSNAVVAHNIMRRIAGSGIEAKDGTIDAEISDNVLESIGAPETTGAVWLHGTRFVQIARNRIDRTAGAAISISDFSSPGETLTQNRDIVVEANFVTSAALTAPDSGAIYVLGRSQLVASQIAITDNLIDGVGDPSPHEGGHHAIGIYLDDNASGVLVAGNVLHASLGLEAAFEIHGGRTIRVFGNIFDVADSSASFGLIQQDEPDQAPQPRFQQLDDIQITGNIFASSSRAPRVPAFANLTSGKGEVLIAGNAYWSFAGMRLAVSGVGAAGDAAPVVIPPASGPAVSDADYADWNADPIGFAPLNTTAVAKHATGERGRQETCRYDQPRPPSDERTGE